MSPTKRSSAPILKEWPAPRVMQVMKKNTAPNPKELAGSKLSTEKNAVKIPRSWPVLTR